MIFAKGQGDEGGLPLESPSASSQEAPAAAASAANVERKDLSEPNGSERQPCPRCGEMISATATRCRFCSRDLRSLLRRPGTWAIAALLLVTMVGASVAALLATRPKSDVELVSTAWSCQSFQDAEEAGRDTDSLNYIADCAIKRSAVDSVHALRGESLEYGISVDDLNKVMDCSTKGDVDEPSVTAACLLDAKLVESP